MLMKRSVEELGELEQNGGELISTLSMPPGTGAWAVLHDDVFSEGLEHRAVIACFGRIQESLNGSTVQFRHLLTSLRWVLSGATFRWYESHLSRPQWSLLNFRTHFMEWDLATERRHRLDEGNESLPGRGRAQQRVHAMVTRSG